MCSAASVTSDSLQPHGFSWQELWSGLPYPPPWDLHDPGIKCPPPVSPELQADSLPWSHQEAHLAYRKHNKLLFFNIIFFKMLMLELSIRKEKEE